jgi:hypothetical protein
VRKKPAPALTPLPQPKIAATAPALPLIDAPNIRRATTAFFQKFGKRAPLALADSAPPDYRRRLYALAQTMLPSDHTLAAIDPMELDGSAIGPFEELLFKALDAEAEKPSEENLPDTVDDPRAMLERTDSNTGLRTIEFRAKKSFIHGLSRTARKVASFQTHRGPVLVGQPWV